MISLLVFDNDTFVRMANNPAVLAELPELAGMLTRLKEQIKASAVCVPCGGGKQATAHGGTVPDWAAMRSAVAGLPQAKQLRLRELMGARRARLFYRDAGGREQHLVF